MVEASYIRWSTYYRLHGGSGKNASWGEPPFLADRGSQRADYPLKTGIIHVCLGVLARLKDIQAPIHGPPQ